MTHKFAIIGTREPSQEQLERVVNLLEWLKGQYGQVELVTGCSSGTEEFAMQVASSMGLPRVGVVPFGKFNRHVQKHCSSIKECGLIRHLIILVVFLYLPAGVQANPLASWGQEQVVSWGRKFLNHEERVPKSPLRVVEGTVTRVADGDTLTIQDDNGTKLKIRLYGIDAPESEKVSKTGKVMKPGQPGGKEAHQVLVGKVMGKRVEVAIMGSGNYKRLAGIVYWEGLDINLEMVRSGWAWGYRQYLKSPYRSEYLSVEESARQSRLGLWRDPAPTPPWEFRKQTKTRI